MVKKDLTSKIDKEYFTKIGKAKDDIERFVLLEHAAEKGASPERVAETSMYHVQRLLNTKHKDIIKNRETTWNMLRYLDVAVSCGVDKEEAVNICFERLKEDNDFTGVHSLLFDAVKYGFEKEKARLRSLDYTKNTKGLGSSLYDKSCIIKEAVRNFGLKKREARKLCLEYALQGDSKDHEGILSLPFLAWMEYGGRTKNITKVCLEHARKATSKRLKNYYMEEALLLGRWKGFAGIVFCLSSPNKKYVLKNLEKIREESCESQDMIEVYDKMINDIKSNPEIESKIAKKRWRQMQEKDRRFAKKHEEEEKRKARKKREAKKGKS